MFDSWLTKIFYVFPFEKKLKNWKCQKSLEEEGRF